MQEDPLITGLRNWRDAGAQQYRPTFEAFILIQISRVLWFIVGPVLRPIIRWLNEPF